MLFEELLRSLKYYSVRNRKAKISQAERGTKKHIEAATTARCVSLMFTSLCLPRHAAGREIAATASFPKLLLDKYSFTKLDFTELIFDNLFNH